MHVIFGKELEGCPAPESAHGLQKIVVGPRGFLDLLEMRLGLPPVFSDEMARALAYREALTSSTESPRFFTESLAVDPAGTAKVLLRWRDELRVAGWDFAAEDAPPRLADLAAVEAHFSDSEFATMDDATRLQKIAAALESKIDPGFNNVDLIESAAHFPLRWRQVLDHLPVRENASPLPENAIAAEGSLLHSLQARLLDRDCEMPDPDDSIRIVRSPVPAKNAGAAAQLIAGLATDKTTKIIGDPVSLPPLDAALRNLDLAGTGSGSRTAAGALAQLAPAVLRLHWAPFDPQAWLGFFLHPVSPLSRRLRSKMARGLQRTPARENPAWQEALDELLESTGDTVAKKRLQKQIDDWLSPEEFPGEANGETLALTMKKLAAWAGKRGANLEDETERKAFLTTSDAFARLGRSLAGFDTVSVEDTGRLINEWLTTATISDTVTGELGAPQRLAKPAHLLEPADHVIWWQPSEKSIHPGPWTASEMTWLSKNGVVFPDPETLREAAQKATRRAILNARQSVALFTSPEVGALENAISPIIVRLLAECGDGILTPPDSLIETAPADRRSLPEIRDEWNLPRPDLLTPREVESFSSLNKFIYSPWDWLLNYQARLRAGDVSSSRIVDDAASQGSLLHGFVESLLEPAPDPLEINDRNVPDGGTDDADTSPAAGLLETLIRKLFDEPTDLDWRTVSDDAIKAWVTDHWEETLTSQAAHYLVPGNEASRSELLYLAKNGIAELIQQLRRADIISVVCEEKIDDVSCFGATLSGFIDLRVENSAGETGVIDLKLGGKANRRDELAKNRHLQLATYGKLVQARHGKSAHCAYFIFSGGGTLLARSADFFPGAEVVKPAKDAFTDDEWETCWEQFQQLWNERRAALNEGRIALQPQIDPPAWKVKDPDKYSDYLNLAGWEETA